MLGSTRGQYSRAEDLLVCLNHEKDIHQIMEWEMLTFLKLSRPNLSFSTPSAPRAYLVTQTVKSLPTVWETLVPSLGWEDPLEKEMVTHSSILA